MDLVKTNNYVYLVIPITLAWCATIDKEPNEYVKMQCLKPNGPPVIHGE